jgi:polyisoprenoid-binding protein YceI
MTSQPVPQVTPPGRAIVAGLTAGAIAAIATSLASLALRSPVPALINSASITLAVLLAGALAGLGWSVVSRRGQAARNFLVGMAVVFALVALAAILVEALPGHPLAHVTSFCVPLAALSLALVAGLTLLFARPSRGLTWIAPVAVIVSLGAGVALASRGQIESGKLALPNAPLGQSSSQNAGTLRSADVAGKAFQIDPNQSKASYSVHEQLTTLPLPDDAVGTTSDVSGMIFLDGRPSTVTVGLNTFKSDDRGRDAHLLRDPGLANFAPARFTTTSLDLPGTYKAGDTITRQVQGTMTINNVSKPMVFAVDGRLQNNTLFLHGQADFTWKDFGITPPSFTQVLQVGDTIHAEVLLVAPAQS